MGTLDDIETRLRKRVGGIPIYFLFLYAFGYLMINGIGLFGPGFAQYRDNLRDYFIMFVGFHLAITVYAEHYQAKKWQEALRNVRVVESIPAIAAGVVVTGICLYLLYMGLGAHPGKTYGQILPYIPYVIVAAGTEEFIFRFVWARATLVKFAKPNHSKLFSEVTSALAFGSFHFSVALIMFGPSLKAVGMILSAVVMGYIWQLCVNLKHELKPGKIAVFFGMGFAIGSHITWNIMVTMFGSTLSVVPFIYVLALGPILVLVPAIILVILCVRSKLTKEASVPSLA